MDPKLRHPLEREVQNFHPPLLGVAGNFPADTSVKWFKLAYESCNEVRFISGRISFINADTQKPVNGNNKGSVLFIWRGNAPKNSHTVTLIDREDLF